jgi:hypothetical protein
MGVYRDDYLLLGAKVDPEKVSWDEHEAEMDRSDGRRFDIVYDGMSGEYAFAGKVLCKTGQFDDAPIKEITAADLESDPDLLDKVQAVFPEVEQLSLFMFQHYH